MSPFAIAPLGAQAQDGPGLGSLAALSTDACHAVISELDSRSKSAVMATSRALKAACGPEHWTRITFADAAQQQNMTAMQLVTMLARSKGRVEVIHLARSPEARRAQQQQRFCKGIKAAQTLPFTQGLRAYALTAMCSQLRHLSLDERASCLGGATNTLCRALATHCRSLETLEVFFQRYSLASELLTDEGLIALSNGCEQLQSLTLHNAGQVSDRALYALAANCPGLTRIGLGGYSESITDGGLTVLFEACIQLTHVKLSSKLLKVTDAAAAALGAHCHGLEELKMPKRMTDSALLALARGCRGLRRVDMRRCLSVSSAGLLALMAACGQLERLLVPVALDVGSVRDQCWVDVVVHEESQELMLLR